MNTFGEFPQFLGRKDAGGQNDVIAHDTIVRIVRVQFVLPFVLLFAGIEGGTKDFYKTEQIKKKGCERLS